MVKNINIFIFRYIMNPLNNNHQKVDNRRVNLEVSPKIEKELKELENILGWFDGNYVINMFKEKLKKEDGSIAIGVYIERNWDRPKKIKKLVEFAEKIEDKEPKKKFWNILEERLFEKYLKSEIEKIKEDVFSILERLGIKVWSEEIEFIDSLEKVEKDERNEKMISKELLGVYDQVFGDIRINVLSYALYEWESIDKFLKRIKATIAHECIHKTLFESHLSDEERKILYEFRRNMKKEIEEKIESPKYAGIRCALEEAIKDCKVLDENLLSKYIENPKEWIGKNYKLFQVLNKYLERLGRIKAQIKTRYGGIWALAEAYGDFIKWYLGEEVKTEIDMNKFEKLRRFYPPEVVEALIEKTQLLNDLINKYNSLVKKGMSEEEAAKEILNEMLKIGE